MAKYASQKADAAGDKMGFFSFLKKKEKSLKCDWCKREIDSPRYTKVIGDTEYGFCSENCKKNFRKWRKQIQSCGPKCACH